MKSKILIIAVITILLSACASKYKFINTHAPAAQFDRIMVVIDYVGFVDGVGELLNYDVSKTKQKITKLQRSLANELSITDEISAIDFAVISSGVGFNPDRPFALYKDGELQTELIYPPFFIDSNYPLNIQDQLLSSLMEAQRIALTPASKDNRNYLHRVRMTTVNFNELKNNPQVNNMADKSTAILHVRVVAPRVSFMKTLGSSVVSVGISSGSVRGSHVGIGLPLTAGAKLLSTALLYDNQTGQVLWKNYRTADLSQLNADAISHFFKGFPL